MTNRKSWKNYGTLLGTPSTKNDKVESKNFDLRQALRELLDLAKSFIVALWWVIAIGGTCSLWFWQVPETRLQPILFAVASAVYALLSKGLYKAKSIQGKYE